MLYEKAQTTETLDFHLVHLPDERATDAFGRKLAASLRGFESVFFSGDLGVGKTTLIRSLLRALGVSGPVRSPTYTLVEPYSLPSGQAFHLDLYRLSSPEEIEFLAGRDLWATPSLKLIEWPEHGYGWLPAPDVEIGMALEKGANQIQARSLRWRTLPRQMAA